MIGNSLSEDAGRYINSVFEAGGVSLDLTVKGVGGSSLSHHAANLKAELNGEEKTWERADYFTYYNGERDLTASTNLLDALNAKQYDVISLQQFSAYNDSDFEEALPYLATEIRKLQPNAEIVLYQTWANYGNEATLTSLNNSFLNTIEPAVSKWAEYVGENVSGITKNGEPMEIIPAGYAFYLGYNNTDFCINRPYVTTDTDAGAKEVAVGIELATGLMRDINHASYYGCYLADAVWFEMLTGRQASFKDENGRAVVPKPDAISTDEHLLRLETLSGIAHNAVIYN